MSTDQIIQLAARMRLAQIAYFDSVKYDAAHNKENGLHFRTKSKDTTQKLKASKALEVEFDEAYANYTPLNVYLFNCRIYTCKGERALQQNRKHTIIIGAQGSGKTTLAKGFANDAKKPLWLDNNLLISEKGVDLLIFDSADRIYKEVLTTERYKYTRKGEVSLFLDMPRCICILQNEYTPNEIECMRQYAEVVVIQSNQ